MTVKDLKLLQKSSFLIELLLQNIYITHKFKGVKLGIYFKNGVKNRSFAI